MRQWFKNLMTPSLRKELLDICKEVAPTRTVHWRMGNGVTFQMYFGRTVYAYVENPKTGVQTYLWTSGDGFHELCKDNTFLYRWVYEAVEQLHQAIEDRRKLEEEEKSLLGVELLGQWQNRNGQTEEYRAMG